MSNKLNLTSLQDTLTEVFINYQWRLDNPMPKPYETFRDAETQYRMNPIFHAKVDCLTAHTTHVVIKWLESQDAL